MWPGRQARAHEAGGGQQPLVVGGAAAALLLGGQHQATGRPAALQLQRRRRMLQPACCPAPAPCRLALLLPHSAQSHSRATPHALPLPLAAAAALASAPTAWRPLQRRARGSRAPRVRSTCRGSRASGPTRRRPNLCSALLTRPRTTCIGGMRTERGAGDSGRSLAARSRYDMPKKRHGRGGRPYQASQRRCGGAADRMRTARQEGKSRNVVEGTPRRTWRMQAII
jgi:hypothetical protein